MLSDRDLHELLSYQAGSPVLSLYLNTEPENGNADSHRLRLRSLLREVDFPEDEAAIMRYFDHEHGWTGRSVAVFSCAAEGYFRAYSLAVPVRSRVRTNDRPHVKPLADLLDSYGGYGVVLVDKQGARVFFFHLGELREQEGVLGESVHHTKRGGGSSAAGRRGGVAGQTDYVDEITERNMKEVVGFATHFFSENNIRRLLIGGTDQNVALFKNLLPKAWQSLVVGHFPMSMTASHTEVMEKAMEVGKEAELRREARLVDSVVTETAKGRMGVLGLEDTLEMVRAGRVHSLVIREGYRAPGYVCEGCGYLVTQVLETCPFCGSSFKVIPDAVETAVRQVMQQGADVEVLHPEQAFGEGQNIGALLRY